MKERRTYTEESAKLAKAIDFAIEAFRIECPANWEIDQLEHVIVQYGEMKNSCLNPDPKFRNLSALKYLIAEVFTYFQEATGPTVEYFWNKIKEVNLDYERENKLEKILTRGKIRGIIEYNYVTDMILVADQIGLISKSQTLELSLMLRQYEMKNTRN